MKYFMEPPHPIDRFWKFAARHEVLGFALYMGGIFGVIAIIVVGLQLVAR